MFYVHDIDGIQFKGPLEALEENRRVLKSRAVVPTKYGGDQPQQFSDILHAKAAASYRQTVKRENMVEPLVHIYQIMSSPVSTIRVDIPIIDAWWMLQQGNIRQLVVTTEKRRVIGVLSDRDILKYINVVDDAVYMNQKLLVGNIIPGEVVTTHAMSDIRRVARVMIHYHIDAMPVLEKEKLVGIVTRGDILRGFAENPKLNLWA